MIKFDLYNFEIKVCRGGRAFIKMKTKNARLNSVLFDDLPYKIKKRVPPSHQPFRYQVKKFFRDHREGFSAKFIRKNFGYSDAFIYIILNDLTREKFLLKFKIGCETYYRYNNEKK